MRVGAPPSPPPPNRNSTTQPQIQRPIVAEKPKPELLDVLQQQLSSQKAKGATPAQPQSTKVIPLETLVRELIIFKKEMETVSAVVPTSQFEAEKRALEAQLAENRRQQTAVEARLAALEKNVVSNKVELKRQLAADRAELALVQSQQRDLMALQEAKLAKQRAQSIFETQPNLWLFYRTFTIKLEEIFLGCKVVSSDFIKTDIQGTLGNVATGMKLVGNVISLLPMAGSAVSAALSGASSALAAVDTARQTNMLKNISQLGTVGELKKLAESIARQLTETYKNQILALRTSEEEQAIASQKKLGNVVDKVKQAVINEKPTTAVQDLAGVTHALANGRATASSLTGSAENAPPAVVPAVSHSTPGNMPTLPTGAPPPYEEEQLPPAYSPPRRR